MVILLVYFGLWYSDDGVDGDSCEGCVDGTFEPSVAPAGPVGATFDELLLKLSISCRQSDSRCSQPWGRWRRRGAGGRGGE
jgi:hypothetical protein